MTEHIKITPDKCRACRMCEAACIAAHYNMPIKEALKQKDTLASRVHVIKMDGLKTSVRCHQCEDAPCCNICPTGALTQHEDGRIKMEDSLCVACEMCIKACPYGAITMGTVAVVDQDQPDRNKTVAVRCDMCQTWRMENGKKITACMEACPVRALYMVEADGSIVEPPAPVKKPVKKATDQAVEAPK